jgi:hypothetical protein
MTDSLKCYEVSLSFDYTLPANDKRVECRIIRQNRNVGVVAPDLEEALRLARELMESEGKQNIEIYQARLMCRVDMIFQRWTKEEIDQLYRDAENMKEKFKPLLEEQYGSA